jgi:hypothetical protein
VGLILSGSARTHVRPLPHTPCTPHALTGAAHHLRTHQDASKRPSVAQLRQHPWIVQHAPAAEGVGVEADEADAGAWWDDGAGADEVQEGQQQPAAAELSEGLTPRCPALEGRQMEAACTCDAATDPGSVAAQPRPSAAAEAPTSPFAPGAAAAAVCQAQTAARAGADPVAAAGAGAELRHGCAHQPGRAKQAEPQAELQAAERVDQADKWTGEQEARHLADQQVGKNVQAAEEQPEKEERGADQQQRFLPGRPSSGPQLCPCDGATRGPPPPPPPLCTPDGIHPVSGHSHGLHRQLYRDAGRRATLGHDNLSWEDFISTLPMPLAWEGGGSGAAGARSPAAGSGGGSSGARSPAAALFHLGGSSGCGRASCEVQGEGGCLSWEEGLALLASPAFRPLLSLPGSRAPSMSGALQGDAVCSCGSSASRGKPTSPLQLGSEASLGVLSSSEAGSPAAGRQVSFAAPGIAARSGSTFAPAWLPGAAHAPGRPGASLRSDKAAARSKSEAAELSAWLEDSIATASPEPGGGGSWGGGPQASGQGAGGSVTPQKLAGSFSGVAACRGPSADPGPAAGRVLGGCSLPPLAAGHPTHLGNATSPHGRGGGGSSGGRGASPAALAAAARRAWGV